MLLLGKARGLGRFANGWAFGSMLIALMVMMPIAALVMQAMKGSGDLWPHLLAYVLPEAVRTTSLLLCGVGLMVISIGTLTAWLVAAYEFPGRRWLEWALLLPLAMPTYIIAYSMLDLLHPIGPVQSSIRALLGYASPRDLQLPDIRSLGGAILLFGFVLYPYVYMATRTLFQMQVANLVEVAHTLGVGRLGVFFRVVLPMARPAIAVGTSLALMEALNDVGASEFLGVRTITVSIYTTWVNRSNLGGAAQIALLMLFVVMLLVMVERYARRHQHYAAGAKTGRRLSRLRLSPVKGLVAFVACVIPVIAGFVVPVSYLVVEAVARLRFSGLSPDMVSQIIHSIELAALATLLALLFGLVLAFTTRQHASAMAGVMQRLAGIGYAVPGTVLALGLLAPLAGLDAGFDWVVRQITGKAASITVFASGSALVLAYVIRFLTMSIGGLENGFQRIPKSIDQAGRTLGATPLAVLMKVHVPIIRPALMSSALLIFVDCMKELPATLLLRPLNFETLATHVYGEAARGTYEDGSIAALAIVLFGLVPVMLIAEFGKRGKKAESTVAFSAERGEVSA
jgi:iron(III) transport system permease protein